MLAKVKYRFLLNLGFLGFNTFLSLFDIAEAREKSFQSLHESESYNFSISNLVDNSKSSSAEELKAKNKKDIFLTLKIFADKKYDYDQKIYLAEGNVKVIINNGTLRSDSLSYNNTTGILTAKGNIRFTKGQQFFRGSEFRFDLLKKKGLIKDAYGILDLKNVLEDLKINSDLEILKKNKSIYKSNNKEKVTYYDGIEFSFGNIKTPQNKITRSNKSIGEINNWRFKSDLITIQEDGWKSDKIIFTNDPFDPHQISFEAIDVIASEGDDGLLLVTSSKTNLILGTRNKFSVGKRIFGGNKNKKNEFELIFDSKDRDGLVISRRSNKTKLNNNLEVDIQPQFLINRALLGYTNSYDNDDTKSIEFSDLFGLNIKANGNYKDWNFDSVNDLSTLNSTRIYSGLRHSSNLMKYFKMPVLDDSNFNIFTTYRSRAWNGTIGETEIKSAYGGFIEKQESFQYGRIKNNLNFRIGTGKYEAEKLKNTQIISLWRSSVFSSLDSEYEIWKSSNKIDLDKKKQIKLAPVLINPELLFRTNINAGYFKYEDESDQAFIKFSLGPEIRLGNLERNFLDYTKLSVMPGIKIKSGNSPFKFDNAIDLKTINISFMQQIYGPLIFDVISNLNIDHNSKNHGEYYDTKLGLLWHKRAYEFGIYYHPNNDAGGLYFRINGFRFDNSVKAVF